jgi:predicted ATP-binding protein involved in virulence
LQQHGSNIDNIRRFRSQHSQVYSVYYLSSRDLRDLTLVRLSDIEVIYFPILTSSEKQDKDKYITQSNLEFELFVEWFKNTEDIENEERINKNISYRDRNLEAVRNAVYSILGSEFKNLKFKRTAEKMTIEKQSLEIAVDWLSDGEKSLLAMVADLAKRLSANNPNSTNPLEETGIVLIDEVELHLHPAWQRKIIPQLTKTFPNCQFIITTHSPQILSHVQPESIYLLKKDGEEIIVDRPQYSYGRDSNRILEDLMEQPERPQEIQDLLSHLFALIHDGELDSAKALLEEISDKIGSSEPELSKAAVAIKRKEIIGR